MQARTRHSETTSLTAGQTTATDYSDALGQGASWLRFAPVLEAEFQRSHVLRVRPQARFWQVLQAVVGVVAVSTVLGGVVSGNRAGLVLGCFAAHLLVSTTLVVLAFSRAYANSYLRVASILTPLRAMAASVIVADIIDTGGSGTAAMTINMFGLLFFSGLLLRQALPAALVMIVSFFAALTAFGISTPVAAYSMTSVLVVFGLSVFVAWDTQRAARIAFLEHGLTRADATRDALTGIANRRHFDARLEALWKSAGNSGKPLTAMLIDVDHFKAFNDTYGHQAGDEALRSMARVLVAEAGKTGLVARFGGEEMAFVGLGLGEHEAEALAGRLRSAVESLEIPHAGAPGAGMLTVSIGGACIVPLAGRSANGALQLADQNLYAAKSQGRNRVVFHRDEYAMMQTGSFRHPNPKP
jgi:diguanylate cyclase (GGDEF)-like protein